MNTEHIIPVIENTPIYRKSDKRSGNRIGYYYIIKKSLKESDKNDVVECIYIKGLWNFGLCVIKEGTYGDTKDSHGRDIKDRLVWQKELHILLQDHVKIPKFLGSFEENGNYYLVIERIKGHTLHKLRKNSKRSLSSMIIENIPEGLRIIEYLTKAILLIKKIHGQGIIHRDVTSNNFIVTPRGETTLIDFELSYSLIENRPSPHFELGTYGYMSPEQTKSAPPTFKQDIYSLGAVAFNMFTGVSPSKITDIPSGLLKRNIAFFINDNPIMNIVCRCLSSVPEDRPDIDELSDTFTSFNNDIKQKRPRCSTLSDKYSISDIKTNIQMAIETLSTSLMADENGWFSNKNKGNKEANKLEKIWYTSFSTGASGVLYFLSKALENGYNVSLTAPMIDRTIELIESRYINNLSNSNGSVYVGGAGIACSLSAAIKSQLLQANDSYVNWIDLLLDLKCDSLGFANGISGIGVANLFCNQHTNDTRSERLIGYTHMLISTQQKDGSWLKQSGNDMMGKGFNYGITGILYYLLEYYSIFGNSEVLQSIDRGLKWLLKHSIKKKKGITWVSSSKKELTYSYSDGLAGISNMFIKAFTVLKDKAYKDIAIKTLTTIPHNIVDNNLSQQSGLCGLGEVYLQAAYEFNNDEFYYRAEWIAQNIMHLMRQDDLNRPYWLVGHERYPVAEFMNGNSGILHHLLRFSSTNYINMPLMR